ncbi:DUF1315 family protein [Neptunomonas sp.]|uniref:YeaC family protein n=1 Tax=Neptunomonas sp. TaxID=1971898 RepID=UPI0025E9356C|nr:DUF1315 family protein [Neptunomonas sp.]
MNYEDLISNMTPEIHQSLKRAIELGKWPTGQALSVEQRETCMRAVIAYDQKHLPEDQRTGYIDRTKKNGTQHGEDSLDADVLKIINTH